MSNYIDDFANKIDKVYQKLPPDVELHMARSCFARLTQQAHLDAIETHGSHETFRRDIGEVINTSDIPIFAQADPSRDLPGKRQPSLVESFDATIDRYIAIDELNGIFSSAADSMIYGGSMKYGPFLNVRSGHDASDIDAIVFTNDTVLDELDWRGVMETDVFDERDKITFFARLGLQRVLAEDDLADITSQRFKFNDENYTISTHLVPTQFLHEAFPLGINESDKKIKHKYVRDYKERPFERTHVSNYDMSRTPHDIPVYNTPTQGGFIAANPAYSVIRGRYTPGMYQNLVLPDIKFVLGDTSRTSAHLESFKRFVDSREEKEKDIDPRASILNTEPRQSILALEVDDIINE